MRIGTLAASVVLLAPCLAGCLGPSEPVSLDAAQFFALLRGFGDHEVSGNRVILKSGGAWTLGAAAIDASRVAVILQNASMTITESQVRLGTLYLSRDAGSLNLADIGQSVLVLRHTQLGLGAIGMMSERTPRISLTESVIEPLDRFGSLQLMMDTGREEDGGGLELVASQLRLRGYLSADILPSSNNFTIDNPRNSIVLSDSRPDSDWQSRTLNAEHITITHNYQGDESGEYPALTKIRNLRGTSEDVTLDGTGGRPYRLQVNAIDAQTPAQTPAPILRPYSGTLWARLDDWNDYPAAEHCGVESCAPRGTVVFSDTAPSHCPTPSLRASVGEGHWANLTFVNDAVYGFEMQIAFQTGDHQWHSYFQGSDNTYGIGSMVLPLLTKACTDSDRAPQDVKMFAFAISTQASNTVCSKIDPSAKKVDFIPVLDPDPRPLFSNCIALLEAAN